MSDLINNGKSCREILKEWEDDGTKQYLVMFITADAEGTRLANLLRNVGYNVTTLSASSTHKQIQIERKFS